MRLPAHWKTTAVSMLLSGVALGAVWCAQRARLGESAATSQETTPTSALPRPDPAMERKILTDQQADEFLLKLCGTFLPWRLGDETQPTKEPCKVSWRMLDNLSPADLVLLLKRAERISDPACRDPLREMLFELCSSVAPDAALNTAKNWPPEFADKLIAGVLNAWPSENGDAARWLQQLEAEHPGDWKQSRRAVAPDTESADGSPNGKQSKPAPASLAEAWSETSKRNDQLGPFNWTDEALAPVSKWAAASGQWEEALKQVKDLPTEHKQQSAREGLLRAWAQQDWRGWLSWEDVHWERRAPFYPGGFTQMMDSAVNSMMNSWHPDEGKVPDALPEFMDRYAESMQGLANPEHSCLYGMGLFKKWIQTEPENASAWLSRQKPGPIRDIAAATLAKASVGEEPVPAMTWAASISDPGRREEALVDSWKAWRALEPAPADAWVDEHSPDIRASAERIDAKRAVTGP